MPVFIIGNPRSGTSLLRLMINAHPIISIPPECGFIIWLKEKYNNLPSNLFLGRIDEFLEDLFKSKKFETWNLDTKQLKNYILEQKFDTYSNLVSIIYKYYGLSKNKKVAIWGDKNNYYLNHIVELKQLFPDSFFIHIIRDGRDVACSYKKLSETKCTSKYAPNLPTETSKIADEWKTNITNINNQFVEFNYEHVIEIRYEDLVLEPKETLVKLCTFIGVNFCDSMLNYYNKTNDHEPAEFLQWKEKTLMPPTTSEVGKYTAFMSDDEITIFNEIAYDVLAKYNYYCGK